MPFAGQEKHEKFTTYLYLILKMYKYENKISKRLNEMKNFKFLGDTFFQKTNLTLKNPTIKE